ncbi:MAG: ABC transporter ATP-binding protein [Phycisphaerales bacterium]|nr:ABC transporter ATP-binding protein [Phycisphaerales bacterium]
MTLLSAHNVFKTYRLGRVDVPVLRGATLRVQRSEFVAVLGSSGSGKSTLLHLLGGLDRPDKGSGVEGGSGGAVVYNGKPLSELGASGLDAYRSREVGFVFQFYHLLPELTVLQNVASGAMIRHGLVGYRVNKPKVEAWARELLASFGLGHRLRHRPAELSGGERQRVAIARALVNDPPVLLADEPTGNLDRKTGASILDALLEHRRATGRTMVLVTHDAEVAARADRIVRLDDGLVVTGP